MSTRSTLTVRNEKDGVEAYSIYRHCDGYPDSKHGVLHTLREALPYAWPLPRFEAMDFAAAIIAAWKKPTAVGGHQGGNIYVTRDRDAHGDTEYHYEIYPNANGTVVVECYAAKHHGDWSKPLTWERVGNPHILT